MAADAYDLSRFERAHDDDYARALAEIRAGYKRSHWMWYIFPQVAGLGRSPMARHYEISGLAEARDFLDHPVLGAHLREISSALLALETSDASEVFGWPDDMKLRSSMTLFDVAHGHPSVFSAVLDKYFGGIPDELTLRILGLAE